MDIRVITPKYSGRIIRSREGAPPIHPQRIQFTDKTLTDQLRIPGAMTRAFLKSKALRESKEASISIGFGLSAEEITGLAIASLLLDKHKTPLAATMKELPHLIDDLCRTALPTRVLVVLTHSNKGASCRVTGIWGKLRIPEQFRPYTTIYDASLLRDQIEIALLAEPLKLPPVRSCEVSE